ncbi:hypothetical protein [Pseudooceanicola nanhaiensis]|uniref:hypothetical protein n=1 Tax=Pseudooceanicola nanhaiensis TaxID=375761 RepID=UPI001CD6B09F|nr:hypothetical protein [Pseudooceanicola nanhaiensis]MCA0918755.1 hypothetical protein [Pseudooceanicola nanhaiensis]
MSAGHQEMVGPHAPFVLLMPWGRVGSNLVTSALAQRAEVRIQNEPTTRIRTYGHRRGRSRDHMRDQQFLHLRGVVARAQRTSLVLGLKLSYRSLLAPEAYLGELSAARFRVVLMVRENALKCAVSQMRALARAQAAQDDAPWQSPWSIGLTEPKPGPSEIDPEEAIRLTHVFAKMHDQMVASAQAAFGDAALVVEYRALAAEPEATMARIFAHVGLVPPERIDLLHRKATSDDLREEIPGYEGFAARVTEAGLGRFLAPEA